MSNVFDKLIEKAKHTGKRIVLTETEDERVLTAAEKAASMDLCKVVLLGSEAELASKFSKEALANIVFVDTTEENDKQKEDAVDSDAVYTADTRYGCTALCIPCRRTLSVRQKYCFMVRYEPTGRAAAYRLQGYPRRQRQHVYEL